MSTLSARGRGASHNPAQRFEPIAVLREGWEEPDDPAPPTQLLRDFSRSIIARNESPDLGFDVSINLYRGCEHGCIYCYARPYHKYLGLSAGLDFETKIVVKEDAPELLRTELSKASWQPRTLVVSGVTDPYQPAERHLKVTRRCLEVLADFRNPVSVVTKSYLVTRDVDYLRELAEHRAAVVTVSITTLDDRLQRLMEPRTSSPARRLTAVAKLADAGIPVCVNLAPVIPGLTDHEMASILEAAADAGAGSAGYLMLRLPHRVKSLFVEWLERHYPDRKKKVLGRVRSIRNGRLGRFRLREAVPWQRTVRPADRRPVRDHVPAVGTQPKELLTVHRRLPPAGVWSPVVAVRVRWRYTVGSAELIGRTRLPTS